MKDTAELIAFDADLRYGPRVGLTRTERWMRASKLGMCPLAVVLEQLQTGRYSDTAIVERKRH